MIFLKNVLTGNEIVGKLNRIPARHGCPIEDIWAKARIGKSKLPLVFTAGVILHVAQGL